MVKQALEGADFIEVFRGFLDAGQSEVESYRSAARVFRGGDVRGRVCFTKDGAYLKGVMMVNVFIRKALQEGRGELLPMLFAGRITTADVIDAGAVPRKRPDRAVRSTCRRGRATRSGCWRSWRSPPRRSGCAWTGSTCSASSSSRTR